MGISKKNNLGIGQDARVFSYNPTSRGPVAKTVFGLLAIFTLLTATPGFAQLPYLEDFTTTTLRDGTATTADWAGTGKVLLPTAALLIDPFTDTTTVEVLPGDFITRDVELADLDGDGDLDLIEGVNGANGVYLNDGTGFFGVARAYTSPDSSNTRSLTIGDVDRDGDIDFVSGNAFGRIRLYLNDGTGTSFVLQDVSSGGRETQSVELVDLDGDGFLDVVAANLGFQQNVIYWNTGDHLTPFGLGGSSGTQLNSSFANESRRVITGDIDKDGDIDLVFMNESEPNPNDGNRQQRNRVYMNELAQGNARVFSHSEIEIVASDDIDASNGGALGDLNGDGFLDLVVVNGVPGEASKIYLNNTSGTANANPFTFPATDFTVAGDPDFAQTARLADADHDGDLDIYLVIAGHSFRNRVYFNDGTGTITGFVDIGSIGQDGLATGTVGVVSNDGALGDVDGDGDLDWVLGNQETQPSTGPLQNILLRSNGTPDLISPTQQQLTARATSLTVDSTLGVASVSLNPLPQHTSLGPQFSTSIDYWVSGNGGTNWTSISADGRPVPIVAGSDVRWRAEMRANSPISAATFAIDQLEIEENANPPLLVTAWEPDPVTVTEGTDVNGAAIKPLFSDADGDILYYSISGLPAGSGLSVFTSNGQLIGTPNNADTLAQPFTVTVTATDGAFSATDSYEIQVTNSNDAPEFTSLPPDLDVGPPATSGATQDVLYSYTVTASDIDPGDLAGLVISTTQLPSWLSLSATSNGVATMSGTPTAADVFVANQTVALVVTDDASATDTQTFAMAITNVNDAPSFASTAVTAATQDALYSYSVVASDPDVGDALTITAPTLPAWMTLVDNGDGTATLSGTPVNAEVGDHTVQLAVTDPVGPAVTQDFTVTVANVDDAPTITSVAVTAATQDVPYTYNVTTEDIDGDVVTITVPIRPAWLSLVDNGDGTATLSGTPSDADVGDNTVQLSVSDGTGTAAGTQDFTVTVANTNDAPTFTSTAVTAATQDLLYTYAVTTNDLDGDPVTITAPALPVWLSLVDNGDGTATLSGTPGNVNVGNNAVQLAVSDGGTPVTQDFTIVVANVNDAPSFTSTAVTTANQNSLYTYAITAGDPDVDVLTITAATLPAWLTLVDNGDGTATLSGTPGDTDVGDNAVQLVVSDGALTGTQDFTITVGNVNDAPTFTSTAVTAATQDVLYTYAVTTNDLDGDVVTITAPTLPAWLTFVDNGDGTATLSGTPNALEVGDHTVQLAVSDGGTPTTQDFTITVANVADAPVFTSTELTAATEAVVYSYTVTVVDPDGDNVTLTAPLLPAWLTFTDNGDGTATLTGTPGGADVGNHSVDIQAQDDSTAGLISNQVFSITVVAAADGPVITLVGNASITITAGNAYNDQGATATDPQDGDLTAQIVVDNPVNTAVAATYTVTYTVMDSAGNTAQAQRTVIVQAAVTPPPPPPPSGGGGSTGPAELFIFAMFGLALGLRRRRGARPQLAA